MGLTRLAVNRPLTILMFVLGLVILGLVARSQLRVDRMPNISFPFVGVSFSYPGASPEDVEALVVDRIEQRLAGLAGVTSINSTSNVGSGSINVSLAEGADADRAAVDVERRLATLRAQLPADVTPSVNRADPNAFPIMNISLTGALPMDELYRLAQEVVQPRLQSVLGVADVQVSGGLQREVRVVLNYARLEGFGLTVAQITQAIARENLDQPGGTLVEGRRQVAIRSVGQIRSVDELRDLIVAATPTGAIYLRDVATVTEGYRERTRLQRTNGQDSVGLSVVKQSDANSIQVADDIKREIDRVRRQLPSGVDVLVTNDSSRFTRAALDAVDKDLTLAIILTALVLLLFLHTWRNVVIVILAIPTSLIATYLVMLAAGFSLNTISLMALALMIGILVDDSIVVLENIHRHLRLGENPILAALNGRSEIGLAAIAITLTDVVVYVPVAFMQGNLGRLFREYGLTIAAATLFSLFISFTLTPMLASRWLKPRNGPDEEGRFFWSRFSRTWERNFDRLASGYGRLLGVGLRLRFLVLLVGVVAFGAALAMIPLRILGTEYAPQEDDGQLSVNIQMPPGTSLEMADQTVRQIEAALVTQVPEIQAMFTSVGAGGFGGFGGGGANGNISIQLVDKSQRERSVFDVAAVARRLGGQIPDTTVRASVQSALGGGGGGFGGGVSVRIAGRDLDTLRQLSADVEQAMRATEGIVDVNNPTTAGNPEVRIVFDRKRMAELGVSGQQVASTVRTLLSGSVVGQIRPPGGIQRDVTVIGSDADRLNLANLANIPVPATGGTVRLSQVATLTRATGPTQIVRADRQRVITLSGTASGRPIGDIARDLRAAVAQLGAPAGYTVQVTGGQVQQLELAFATLLGALTLSILLIYMLMVALYESFLHPLAIMFSLPVALVGAFGGLLVTGNTLNIFSMIGMIMLTGLVAKNAILLVDYTNILRKRGLARAEAIVEAGRTRLRPIVMTTATIVCAMTPLALKLEAGAESRAPMAVVMIGGVLSSTLLTLFLVPAVYTYLDDFQNWLGGGFRLPVLRRRVATAPALAAGLPLRPAEQPAMVGGE
ncbi:MAG: efflux RND transporter permease subunit [Chloroflexi bacterium]|nr:efflux RND transporter permease subunit [Chloroflexota bacterium]